MTSGTDISDPDQTRPASSEAEDFPAAVVDGISEFLGKPRARGWIHVYAAAVAAVAGVTLVSVSWALQGTRAGIATLIYTITIVGMFTVSGTYHRVNWTSPTARTFSAAPPPERPPRRSRTASCPFVPEAPAARTGCNCRR